MTSIGGYHPYGLARACVGIGLADELQLIKPFPHVYRNFGVHCLMRGDEVETLAYQLNEEAERTERPIRRLSEVMYGSTCADMQVDVMGECLSSIKHVVGREMANNKSVRRHLDAFTRGRIIGKLEEGRSVTSVAAEFGIAHSIVSRLWRQLQTTGTASYPGVQ
ncbi:transposable element Tcb2 transposase [Trichonephila clavipes]|nr:transposable element Tcb2 transposase [Trichonephila clavipes]